MRTVNAYAGPSLMTFTRRENSQSGVAAMHSAGGVGRQPGRRRRLVDEASPACPLPIAAATARRNAGIAERARSVGPTR